MSKIIRASATIVALFSLTATITPSAAAKADHAGELTRSGRAVTGHAVGLDGKEIRSPEAERKVLDFWTPSRMRQAKNLDVVEIDASGNITASPGTPPAKESVSSPGAPAPSGLGSGGGDFSTSGAVFNADAPAVGKLFAQDPTNGSTYICSASVVGGNNGRTVLTAAHCLWDPNRRVRLANVIFVPDYRNGVAPRGIWPMSDFIWPAEWNDHGQWHWDYAFFTVPNTTSGNRIIEYTGYLGFTANILSHNFTDSMGYPAAPPFNGEQQKRDHAFATITDFVNTAPPELDGYFVKMDSAFTPGSSGGPWVDNYDVNTRLGAARGLNSFKINGSTDMFSPYFDWDTWDMFIQAGNLTT